MKLLAWLYLKMPMWCARLLPDKINQATEGPFNDALEKVYNKWADRVNKRANRRANAL